MSSWQEKKSEITGIVEKSKEKKLIKAHWITMKEPREFRSRGFVLHEKYQGDLIQVHGIYFRKEFAARPGLVRATAYISGLGYYELHVNREIVGNHPKLFFQLEMEYESGETERIVSDTAWKVSHGPLQENGIYYGEKYDGRLEMPGWDLPGYDDSSWEFAVPAKPVPLSSQIMTPIRKTQILSPKKLINPKPGVFIYDFGQNFSGWAKLKLQGPEGTEVKLRYGGFLYEDLTLNTATNRNAEATDVYILKGKDQETYEPRFTYHGFRYVEVTGFPRVPSLENAEGYVVHSDVEKMGEFQCSNDLINRIHHNVLWSQRSNLMSIPTDCPQRDERHGWLGDAHLTSEEAIFNFDMAAFYSQFLEAIRLAQKEDGSLPDVVPPFLPDIYPADPAWSSVYVTIAWLIYFYYGDTRVLEKHFVPLRKYINFLQRNAEENIIRRLGKYGDWCPLFSLEFPHLAQKYNVLFIDNLGLAGIIIRLNASLQEKEEKSRLRYRPRWCPSLHAPRSRPEGNHVDNGKVD